MVWAGAGRVWAARHTYANTNAHSFSAVCHPHGHTRPIRYVHSHLYGYAHPHPLAHGHLHVNFYAHAASFTGCGCENAPRACADSDVSLCGAVAR